MKNFVENKTLYTEGKSARQLLNEYVEDIFSPLSVRYAEQEPPAETNFREALESFLEVSSSGNEKLNSGISHAQIATGLVVGMMQNILSEPYSSNNDFISTLRAIAKDPA